jgi:hypothetical protein
MLVFVGSKKNKLLAGAAVLVILGLLLVSVSVARRTPVFPPLPNPNGYDDLVKAGKLINSGVNDFPALSETELRNLVMTNAEALRLCRVGLSRTCSVPTEVMITNFSGMMPDLPDLKRLAQLLAAEGRLAEMEHRRGDAAHSYAEALQLGNDISRGGLLIHRLVGIAIQAIGGTRLAKIIPELDSSEARPARQLLDDVDNRGVTWEEIQHNEKLFCRHELRKLPSFVSAIVNWWSSRSVKERTRERHNAAVAHIRLMLLELGVRCYTAENNRAPAALQDLVPRYLSHVPGDPFTRQAFVYKPQQTNWVLYSVGPDGVDDGGRSAGRLSKKGDVLYSSSW